MNPYPLAVQPFTGLPLVLSKSLPRLDVPRSRQPGAPSQPAPHRGAGGSDAALGFLPARVEGLLHLAFASLTLPALAYSFNQLWTLTSGDVLEHAVRAFLP